SRPGTWTTGPVRRSTRAPWRCSRSWSRCTPCSGKAARVPPRAASAYDRPGEGAGGARGGDDMQAIVLAAAWRLSVAAALAATVPAPARAAAPVDLGDYVRRDRFEDIRISPDGRHLAATVPLEDRGVLVVLDRATGGIASGGAGAANTEVVDFWWADDGHV